MRPMLASPTPTPPTGPLWRHELKWDGVRAIVRVESSRVTIATRSGKDCTRSFPEITESGLADFSDLILDGEIVALVNDRPDFSAVMHRLSPRVPHMRASAAVSPAVPARDRDAERTPAAGTVVFIAFDILAAAGHDVTALPWHQRRELLEGIGLDDLGAVQVPPVFDDPGALLAATAQAGLEGIVSKRLDAPYRPGVRSEDWLKSVHRTSDSFVIAGWRPISGQNVTVGALLLAEPIFNDRPNAASNSEPGDSRESQTVRWLYRGRVGSGFSKAASSQLLEWVTAASASPFGPDQDVPVADQVGTHWVRPELVCDVEFLGRSAGGRLRQPTYKGLRLDLGVQALIRPAESPIEGENR